MYSTLRAALRAFKFAPGEFVLRASCPMPFGPAFGCSNSLPANLSNLISVLIFSAFIYKRPFTSTFIFGWAGRIRTSAYQDQNLVPYRLATAQYKHTLLCYRRFLVCAGSYQDPISINLAGALPPGNGTNGPVYIVFMKSNKGDWFLPWQINTCQLSVHSTFVFS